MALKRKIDQEAYDALSDKLKFEYKKVGDNYILDLEGDDDNDNVAELKRAKDREVQARKTAEKERDTLKAQLEEGEDLTARKKGDIDALEKSWKEKNEKLTKDFNEKLLAKDSFIKNTLVDNVARDMAAKISNAPALLIPHIKARLTADLDGDTPATKVLDATGKASALSLEDLQKELVDNADFSAIIIGSKANGSGAANTLVKPNGSATLNRTNDDNKPLDMTKAGPKELAAMLKSKAEAS